MSETNYNWTHDSYYHGDNYYRLKQVDFDGQHEYSQTLLVRNASNEDKRLLLYPNPANSKITAQYFSDQESEALFIVANLSGRILIQSERKLTKGDWNYPIDLSNIEKGQYLLIVSDNGRNTVQSFMKH